MNEPKNPIKIDEALLTQISKDTQLIKAIEGLGFSEQYILDTTSDTRNRSTIAKFLRDPEANTPELEVVVDRAEDRYHVIVNSTPYDERYHRNTGSPIKRDQIIDQIKQYLREVTGQ